MTLWTVLRLFLFKILQFCMHYIYNCRCTCVIVICNKLSLTYFLTVMSDENIDVTYVHPRPDIWLLLADCAFVYALRYIKHENPQITWHVPICHCQSLPQVKPMMKIWQWHQYYHRWMTLWQCRCYVSPVMIARNSSTLTAWHTQTFSYHTVRQ